MIINWYEEQQLSESILETKKLETLETERNFLTNYD